MVVAIPNEPPEVIRKRSKPAVISSIANEPELSDTHLKFRPVVAVVFVKSIAALTFIPLTVTAAVGLDAPIPNNPSEVNRAISVAAFTAEILLSNTEIE